MSTASAGPPKQSIAGGSSPLSGPTKRWPSSAARTAIARRGPPTPGSTIARWTATGANGTASTSAAEPSRTSWRLIPWVMSITSVPGAIRAITARQMPAKSSATP